MGLLFSQFFQLPRRAARLRALLLILVGGAVLLGLTTDLFRSPRAVVRGALAGLARPADHELRFLVDVRADQARVKGAQYHHLQFRAGPGPLLRTGEAPARLEFPFRLILERRGVVVNIRGTSLLRDGIGYLRITEMPAYGKLGETLEGRWLVFGGQPTTGGEPAPRFGAAEGDRLLSLLLAPDVLRSARGGATARVRGLRTRTHNLAFDDDRLRSVLGELPQAFPEQGAVAAVASFLEGRLRDFRVDRVRLWIRPRSHDLVRARLELVPRAEGSEIARVVFDATLVPAPRGAAVAEPPKGAIRLQPETIQKILGR